MNILITGASRGIGFELVKMFLNEENNVVVLTRNIQQLQALKSKSVSLKGNLFLVQFDLLKIQEQKHNLITTLINNKVNNVDLLINNAGLLINKGFDSFHYEEIEKIMQTNFIAPSILIRELMPFLLKSSLKAHVVNISSMGGFQGSTKFGGLSYYSASKAALANLTECLAEEYKEAKIAFNCLALGAVQTEMLNEAFPGYKAMLSATEMAKYIKEFSLTGQNFFNGKVIPVSLSTP